MLNGPSGSWKESTESEIIIQDCRYEVFLKFVEFLYTEDVQDIRNFDE